MIQALFSMALLLFSSFYILTVASDLLNQQAESTTNISSSASASNQSQDANQTAPLLPSREKQITPNSSDRLSLNLQTPYDEYTSFQNVEIWARVNPQEGQPVKLLLEEKNSTGDTVYKITQITNRPFFHFLLHSDKIGVYNVSVTAVRGGDTESSYITFKVISILETNTVRFLTLALIFVGGLLIIISISKKNDTREEVLRFVFLSGIVGSILCSFLFTDIEFGKNNPVGLVRLNKVQIDQLNQLAQNETNIIAAGQIGEIQQWVFDIGGALAIPVYVVVFGLIGGYLRYLYKTSRLLIDPELRAENQDVRKYLTEQGVSDVERRAIFFQALKDIALFFLAPILAIVVWFLFSQWEPISDSPTLLAVFSFASGLVTTEIVDRISDFTKENLEKRTKST
jgi:hypothetical protein